MMFKQPSKSRKGNRKTDNNRLCLGFTKSSVVPGKVSNFSILVSWTKQKELHD